MTTPSSRLPSEGYQRDCLTNRQWHICGCVTAFDVCRWRNVALERCASHTAAEAVARADAEAALTEARAAMNDCRCACRSAVEWEISQLDAQAAHIKLSPTRQPAALREAQVLEGIARRFRRALTDADLFNAATQENGDEEVT